MIITLQTLKKQIEASNQTIFKLTSRHQDNIPYYIQYKLVFSKMRVIPELNEIWFEQGEQYFGIRDIEKVNSKALYKGEGWMIDVLTTNYRDREHPYSYQILLQGNRPPRYLKKFTN